MIIKEGRLQFDFPFDAISFDNTIYYRKHFMQIQKGVKAIDILAIKGNRNYMIEIKDYTHPNTEELSQIQLIEDIVKKIICSLSTIYPMALNANNEDEKDISIKFLKNSELFIIFHIEIPPPRRGLSQSRYRLSNIQTKLRERLKSITSKSHIKVVSKDNLKNLPWSVTVATN